VEVNDGVFTQPGLGFLDQIGHRLGRGDGEGIDNGELGCARILGCLVDAFKEGQLASRRVDTEEGDMNAGLDAESTAFLMRFRTSSRRYAECFQLPVRNRCLDHGMTQSKIRHGGDVVRHGAGEAPDFGLEAGGGDQLDGLAIILGYTGKAGFDASGADLIHQGGDLEFLFWVEHDAGGLFTVAQRGVVEADLGPRAVGQGEIIEVSGPDLVSIKGAHGIRTLQRVGHRRRRRPSRR
jgi:hypothetical protein